MGHGLPVGTRDVDTGVPSPTRDDEVMDQGLACVSMPSGPADLAQPSTAPMAIDPSASERAFDLDQLLVDPDADDWDALFACGQLPCA